VVQPQPGTPEAVATEKFLTWLAGVLDHDEQIFVRAQVAKRICENAG
jgi:hypothetical protein